MAPVRTRCSTTLAAVIFCAGLTTAQSSAVSAAGLAAQNPPAQQVPPQGPKPFPQPGQPSAPATPPAQTPTTPAPPAQTAAAPGVVNESTLGAPIFPGAEALTSVDAGQGQRYYLFGTTASYADVVAFYKQALKTGGRELFKAPAMQQFDLGKFQEDSMVFVPSVVVKDYTWNGSTGYLQVTGTAEKRFATVIQIVPAPPR